MRKLEISVSAVKVRGQRLFMVSWKPPGGKRKRLYRATRTVADSEAESLRLQKRRTGEVWLALAADKRDEIIRLHSMFNWAHFRQTLRESWSILNTDP